MNTTATDSSTQNEAIGLPGRAPRADELYEHLRGQIVSGDLAPGERLVEETIARQASVSRTPVREALHRLEMDGLVESSGRGVAVIDFSGPELSELCTVRAGMEAFGARLAATSISDVELQMLERLLDTTRQVVEAGDVAGQVELNHRFHETVWQASRNGYLIRQLELLRSLIERGRTTTLSIPERQAESLREHTALFEALRRHDPAAAEAIASEHFAHATALRLMGPPR